MQEMSVRELQQEVVRLREEVSRLKSARAGWRRGSVARAASRWRIPLGVLVGVAILGAASYAGQITNLITFINGTTADAGEVNANFSTLANESNQQDLRITDLENRTHGDLLGLLDDDHPQYLLQNGSEPVTGTLTVSQDIVVNGSTVLGDASDDTTTINDLLVLTGRATAPPCVIGTVYYDTSGFNALCVCVESVSGNVFQPLGPGSCS